MTLPAPPAPVSSTGGSPEGRPARGTLAYWRERTVRVLLLSAVLLGVITYPPSVWLAVHTGVWSVAAVDTGIYAYLLLLTVWNGAPYRLRAWSIAVSIFVLGVFLMAALGQPGAGLTWLAMAPVLSAVLLGPAAAISSLAAMGATIAVFAFAIGTGTVTWSPAAAPGDQIWMFLVNGTNALLLSTAGAMPVAVLLRGLEETNRELAREALERQRVEADRTRLEQQLQQAQKLEAVGRLAGGIAHDFNNLLTPILVYTEEARSELPLDSSAWHRLGEVLQSAKRASHLVRRILTFSRQAVVTRGPLRLDEMLRETGALLRATLPRTIDIQYDIRSEQTTIFADAAEVQQILMNLGTNALDAMRERGGTLTFAIADGPDNRVRLTVTDTGSGMEQHVLEHALEPFFTTKPSGKGTGLGLATVHGIVTALGGTLQLSSELGRGTTIELLLPRHEVQARTAPASGPRAVVPHGKGERVLLVDDEPGVLGACEMLLRRMGYEVTALLDPAAALVGLQRDPGAFDLLITDQSMPGMTGAALSVEARRLRPDLPVILATGFLDGDAQDELSGAGIRHLLSKPYTPHELGSVVRAALAESTGVAGAHGPGATTHRPGPATYADGPVPQRAPYTAAARSR